MEIWILIKTSTWTPLRIFTKGFSNLRFSEYLDGIGTGTFQIQTQSDMLQLLQPSNIIDVIDISNNDKVIWTGWVRPFQIDCNTWIINLTEIKDRMNYRFIETTGSFTSLNDLLTTLWYPFDLNKPDLPLDVEYKSGFSFYNILEEARKQTGYDWGFDGTTLTFGCIGVTRSDIWFDNTIKESCNSTNPWVSISNIKARFLEQYDRVIAIWDDGLVATAWSWEIEQLIDIETLSQTELQTAADEYLKLWQGRRIITFDVNSERAIYIDVWDSVLVSISEKSDIFNTDQYVRVLKKEYILDWCTFRVNLSVSETNALLRDNDFNLLSSLLRRINRLETGT